nr:MAG TPA: hypothetical protein [Caudoviricetes sp.]
MYISVPFYQASVRVHYHFTFKCTSKHHAVSAGL